MLAKNLVTALNEVTKLNGHAKDELFNKVVIATKELVKEMGDGVEFHLSLNPPAYASEESGTLTIDYKKIKDEINQQVEKSKQIEASNSKPKETQQK